MSPVSPALQMDSLRLELQSRMEMYNFIYIHILYIYAHIYDIYICTHICLMFLVN